MELNELVVGIKDYFLSKYEVDVNIIDNINIGGYYKIDIYGYLSKSHIEKHKLSLFLYKAKYLKVEFYLDGEMIDMSVRNSSVHDLVSKESDFIISINDDEDIVLTSNVHTVTNLEDFTSGINLLFKKFCTLKNRLLA